MKNRRNSAKVKIGKYLSLLLCFTIVLSISIEPIIAIPENNNEITLDKEIAQEIKSTIGDALPLMQICIQENYNTALETVKKEIVEKKYDYYTTLESITVTGNPCKKINYADLLSAYIVISSQEENINFYTLPFFTYSIEESSYEQKLPFKTNIYEKLPNGNYEKIGIEYILDDCVIDNYIQLDNGEWKKDGTISIKLETETISYGIVTFNPLTGEELLNQYGITKESELYEDYERRYELIEYSFTTQNQSSFIAVSRNDLIDADTQAYINELLKQYNGTNTGVIIEVSTSLVGQVPYQWGGKSSMAGYDTSWFSFDLTTGEQKGLDCSGYVQWVYRSAGCPEVIWQDLLSTSSILETQESISEAELEVGDLGLLNGGESINHVGIYLGEGYWIHCNSSANTVSIDKTTMFTIFRKVNNISNYTLEAVFSLDNHSEKSYTYSESDIEILAKYIGTLGKGRGLNTWIALAEIVKYRIESEDYPNTISEILSDTTLFGISESEITVENPSEELKQIIRDVLDGKMSILEEEADCARLEYLQNDNMQHIATIEDIFFYDLTW